MTKPSTSTDSQWFTVLYVYEENMQICAQHIEAEHGLAAMTVLSAKLTEEGQDPILIAAVPGLHVETTSNQGDITFAGASAVYCSQFIENHGDRM